MCLSADLPVDHHRDPLPGSEGRHTLQLLVSDPYWNQKLLRVAGAQPVDNEGQDNCIILHFKAKIMTAARLIQ